MLHSFGLDRLPKLRRRQSILSTPDVNREPLHLKKDEALLNPCSDTLGGALGFT